MALARALGRRGDPGAGFHLTAKVEQCSLGPPTTQKTIGNARTGRHAPRGRATQPEARRRVVEAVAGPNAGPALARLQAQQLRRARMAARARQS